MPFRILKLRWSRVTCEAQLFSWFGTVKGPNQDARKHSTPIWTYKFKIAKAGDFEIFGFFWLFWNLRTGRKNSTKILRNYCCHGSGTLPIFGHMDGGENPSFPRHFPNDMHSPCQAQHSQPKQLTSSNPNGSLCNHLTILIPHLTPNSQCPN